MDEDLRKAALDYHRLPSPGKISVAPTKGLVNQRDLALAYTPGVAIACEEIVANPGEARNLTARGNLVAVITNGTAVLGLGAIGPLAAKPVMEGKAVLFRKFAGIDVFDIEVNERDPEKLVDIIASLEPTFGGINLEDIKAPECFIVERKLRARMKIPVFHDDQHGTAIIVGAAILNGLKVVGKDIKQVKLVVSGAGAAAHRLPESPGGHGAAALEYRRDGYQGRRLPGAQGGDGPREGALRRRDPRAHPRRGDRRRRRFSRPLRGRRAEAGDGEAHGRAPADPRARQSRARDPSGSKRSERSPTR